jgi:3-dehydroquinate synthase
VSGTVRIDVATERPYPVLVGRGVRAELLSTVTGLGAAAALIVHQPALADVAEQVRAELEGAGVDAHRVEVPDAEDGKALAVAGFCWEVCGRVGLTRGDVVVSLGGGAVTDLAGFVAATWMRGVRVVHVPTTLLAMVDAAVGGKTGINTEAGKNLVGAFLWPERVVVDPDTLSTLPESELENGLAEVVKTGLLSGEPLWELDREEQVRRAAAFKAGVCLRDPRDEDERAQLNLGHTFAHALEAASGYALPHGRAVALGLLAALRLSGLEGEAETVLDVLRPQPVQVDREAAWAALARDKKARGGSPRLVLLDAPGRPRWGVEIELRAVRAALDALIA